MKFPELFLIQSGNDILPRVYSKSEAMVFLGGSFGRGNSHCSALAIKSITFKNDRGEKVKAKVGKRRKGGAV
ncbi:MAG: hypothetical protein K8T91_20080 [Planctomycetes bacterium]|nr:hypothetical protein [Planctomycetota bacterium]